MCEFEGWVTWLEPAFLLWKPTYSDYERPPYMTRTEEDKPQLTPDQEFALMTKEVNESDGFDIDFKSFRCVFNYHPTILDSYEFSEDETETTKEFLSRLAQESLDDHNAKYDLYDDKIKLFQTRIRHGHNISTNYVFCRPKPNQGVEYIEIKKDAESVVKRDIEEVVKSHVQEDVKKQKLEHA